MIAGIPIGAGALMIFLQGFSYLIDVHLLYANTVLRSLAGAVFPLFTGHV
jgi:hypothetical protein